MNDEARRWLDLVGLDISPSDGVSGLSVAQMQLVEVAKALSLEARTLLLDEPTASITPHEVEYLFDVLRRLRDQGVAILFVSHKLEEVFDLCDHVTVPARRPGRRQRRAARRHDAGPIRTLMSGAVRSSRSLPPKEVAENVSVLEVRDLRTESGGHDISFGSIGGDRGTLRAGGRGPDRAGASTHRSRPVDRRRDPRQGEAGTHPQRARRPGDHRIGT